MNFIFIARDLFNITPVKVVLECDGTEIRSNEYFETLEMKLRRLAIPLTDRYYIDKIEEKLIIEIS